MQAHQKEHKENPLPSLDVWEVKRVELPAFDPAKVKLPDTHLFKTHLIEHKLITKDAKSLADIPSLKISDGLGWQVITENLLSKTIVLETDGAEFYIAFIFNKETNQHYYLLNCYIESCFESYPDDPDCLIGITNKELQIWHLNKCHDADCTLPRGVTFSFDIEEGFSAIRFYRFLQGTSLQLMIASTQGARIDTTYYRYLYLIEIPDIKKIEDINSIRSPVLTYCQYNINENEEHSCQKLNENEFLLIEYDILRNQNIIVFYQAKFNYPHEPTHQAFQHIPLSELQIDSNNYFCSFISPKGKYLAIVERCFKDRFLDYENCDFVFKSFELLKNEKNQYEYKKISQAKLAGNCSFWGDSLSSEGFLKWSNQGQRYIWNIRTDQIMTIQLPPREDKVLFHNLHDLTLSLTGPRSAPVQALSIYQIQDPRIVFEARAVLKSFSNNIFGIVAGYVSQSAASFFTTNTCALSTLSALKERKNSENDQAALDTFFNQDKLGFSLDTCALEALKHHPSEKIKALLNTILKSFQDYQGYAAPALTG